MEIFDAAGKLVRRFASDDKPLAVDVNTLRFPTYWIRPNQILKNEPGMQRFVWDLMYPNPPSDAYDLLISAIYKDTPFVPQGPAVMPGIYMVKLTVDGKSFNQKLNVRIDPRVTTPLAGLQKQFTLSMLAYDGIIRSRELEDKTKKLAEQLKTVREKAGKDTPLAKNIETVETKLNLLVNGLPPVPGKPLAAREFPISRLTAAFTGLLDLVQDADVSPTTQANADSTALQTALNATEIELKNLVESDLPVLNGKLRQANLIPIEAGAR